MIFLRSSWQIPGQYLDQVMADCFLPNPFYFIIHLSPYHLCSLRRIKIAHRNNTFIGFTVLTAVIIFCDVYQTTRHHAPGNGTRHWVSVLSAIPQLRQYSPASHHGSTVKIQRIVHVGFMVYKNLDFYLSLIIPPVFQAHPQGLVQESQQSLGIIGLFEAMVPRDSITLCPCKKKKTKLKCHKQLSVVQKFSDILENIHPPTSGMKI